MEDLQKNIKKKKLYQFYNSTQPLHSANNNYDLATYTVTVDFSEVDFFVKS